MSTMDKRNPQCFVVKINIMPLDPETVWTLLDCCLVFYFETNKQ